MEFTYCPCSKKSKALYIVNKEVRDEGTIIIGGGPEGNPDGAGLVDRWEGLAEEDEEEGDFPEIKMDELLDTFDDLAIGDKEEEPAAGQ